MSSLETIIALKESEFHPMRLDMQPTLEKMLALEPPYELHIVASFRDDDSNGIEQYHVGIRATPDNIEDARGMLRDIPEWEPVIAAWAFPAPRPDPGTSADQIVDQVILDWITSNYEGPAVTLQEVLEGNFVTEDDVRSMIVAGMVQARSPF